MDMKKLRLPSAIIALGIIATVIVTLLVGIVKHPTVTEQDFNFSVTYRIGEETKTINGVYKCSFDAACSCVDSPDRYYIGEYVYQGLSAQDSVCTVAEKDGLDLCIIVSLNSSYLMGDTENEYYDDSLEEPYLAAYDSDECGYEDAETIAKFDAEIISYEYPEPIENSFVFAGFSLLYESSMLVMILTGLVTLLVCFVGVKRDGDVVYASLDKLGALLNLAALFVVLPFITLAAGLIQAYKTGPNWIYQGYLCLPVIIVFSIVASLSLRRKEFSKSGFFVQFIGAVIFAVLAIFELIL